MNKRASIRKLSADENDLMKTLDSKAYADIPISVYHLDAFKMDNGHKC
jgi:hypothetical protein